MINRLSFEQLAFNVSMKNIEKEGLDNIKQSLSSHLSEVQVTTVCNNLLDIIAKIAKENKVSFFSLDRLSAGTKDDKLICHKENLKGTLGKVNHLLHSTNTPIVLLGDFKNLYKPLVYTWEKNNKTLGWVVYYIPDKEELEELEEMDKPKEIKYKFDQTAYSPSGLIKAYKKIKEVVKQVHKKYPLFKSEEELLDTILSRMKEIFKDNVNGYVRTSEAILNMIVIDYTPNFNTKYTIINKTSYYSNPFFINDNMYLLEHSERDAITLVIQDLQKEYIKLANESYEALVE